MLRPARRAHDDEVGRVVLPDGGNDPLRVRPDGRPRHVGVGLVEDLVDEMLVPAVPPREGAEEGARLLGVLLGVVVVPVDDAVQAAGDGRVQHTLRLGQLRLRVEEVAGALVHADRSAHERRLPLRGEPGHGPLVVEGAHPLRPEEAHAREHDGPLVTEPDQAATADRQPAVRRRRVHARSWPCWRARRSCALTDWNTKATSDRTVPRRRDRTRKFAGGFFRRSPGCVKLARSEGTCKSSRFYRTRWLAGSWWNSDSVRTHTQNMTVYNPAPSPSGHPLLSGPPTLNEYSPNIHSHIDTLGASTPV
eukprot:scaffold108735_cov69-Phaeocystis_antarctica.AAC.2